MQYTSAERSLQNYPTVLTLSDLCILAEHAQNCKNVDGTLSVLINTEFYIHVIIESRTKDINIGGEKNTKEGAL